MGAAEYSGRPSPVLKLRLDHAAELYRRHFATYMMTTGGPGGDPKFTEGGVGRSYLVEQGVPAEAIIVENTGDSTVYSLAAASEILKRMGLKSCIVVSDGYHLFRAKRILMRAGMVAYGSPRADVGTPAVRGGGGCVSGRLWGMGCGRLGCRCENYSTASVIRSRCVSRRYVQIRAPRTRLPRFLMAQNEGVSPEVAGKTIRWRWSKLLTQFALVVPNPKSLIPPLRIRQDPEFTHSIL